MLLYLDHHGLILPDLENCNTAFTVIWQFPGDDDD